jgi:hypothetical protein
MMSSARSRIRPSIWITAQALIAVAAVPFLALVPPAQGKMMIVSLSGQSAGEIAAWASREELAIIGQGSIAGSLVVRTEGGTLADKALRHGGIVVAAPATGCGATA